MKKILQSERLVLRELVSDDPGDASFMRALVNDPGWLQYIGDRDVHDDEAGRAYVAKIEAGYRESGFGFWAVCRRGEGEERDTFGPPLGICGLIKRATLPAVDLGFAFLPAARGQGIAREAARASIDLARDHFKMPELLAITDPANTRSIHLLESLGFTLQRRERLDPKDIELCVFQLAL